MSVPFLSYCVLCCLFFQLFHLFAGFLSQLAQGKPMDECIRCGHYAANYMIQQSGVTMTQLPNFS